MAAPDVGIEGEIFEDDVVNEISGPFHVYIEAPAPPVEVAVSTTDAPTQNGLLGDAVRPVIAGCAVTV